MRQLIIALALTLAAITAAPAQGTPALPKTITFRGPDNTILGTATINGNSIYFRDAKGELSGTTVIQPDGSKIMYDPSGKITGTTTVSGTTTTVRDADGNITGTGSVEDGKLVLRNPDGKVITSGTPHK